MSLPYYEQIMTAGEDIYKFLYVIARSLHSFAAEMSLYTVKVKNWEIQDGICLGYYISNV